MIEAFFRELDQDWKATGHEPIGLHLFGSAALMLQMDYVRGTKDADIFEIEPIPKPIAKQLEELAGKDSRLFKRHGMYIQIVQSGVPFLPPRPLFHEQSELGHQLDHFKIKVMDLVDIVISKLKPFRPTDLDDIRAVIEAERLDVTKLLERFHLAKEQWLLGSRAGDLKRIVQNLHVIQRDYLFVTETPIALPDWLE